MSNSEREQVLETFREAQRLKEKGEAKLNRRRPLPRFLLPAIIAFLVVGGGAAFFGIPVYLQFQVVDPAKSFCRLVSAHDARGAYALFSTSFRHMVSFTQFSQDIATSRLANCTTASGTQFNGFQTARITMTFDYAGPTADSPVTQADGSFSFINENGGWRISSMKSSELSMP